MKIEQINKYISRAYSNACNHGFHDKKLSEEHCLMLIQCEIAEAVEADRKGKEADLVSFDAANKYYGDFKPAFERYIKDTVADELADVCIRIFDMCGVYSYDMRYHYDVNADLYASRSFCENCYWLTHLLYVINPVSERLYGLLCAVETLCWLKNIDLQRHIELKMKYNEMRPKLHGKSY